MTDAKKLELKKNMKKKKPAFKRREETKHAKLKETWRRPKGKHNKQRMHEKSAGALPNPGYGTPKELRGLNKDGLEEIIISNVKDLSNLDPKVHAGLVAGTVGAKKRAELSTKAKELKIKLVNVKSI